MKASTAAAMLPILASVFDKGRDGGTARDLDSPNFAVGGKTGTARKVDPATHAYSTELYVASFAGLAPIDQPRIAVTVVLDEPRGEYYYGSRVAGPAFVRVVDETLRYLGVAANIRAMAVAVPESPAGAGRVDDGAEGDEGDGDGEDEVGIPTPAMVDSHYDDPSGWYPMVIPDFRGMSIGKAIEAAAAAGITPRIKGSGRAIEQSSPPGPGPEVDTVTITFSQTSSMWLPAFYDGDRDDRDEDDREAPRAVTGGIP